MTETAVGRCIGDRYRIGRALFEVTQPRVTCYRIGMRMNEPRMAALLVSHGRPGFYFRMIDPCNHRSGPRAPGRSCRLRAAISRFTGIRKIGACSNLPKPATFPSDGRAAPGCATPARADSWMEQSTIGPIRSNPQPRAICLSVARNPGARRGHRPLSRSTRVKNA